MVGVLLSIRGCMELFLGKIAVTVGVHDQESPPGGLPEFLPAQQLIPVGIDEVEVPFQDAGESIGPGPEFLAAQLPVPIRIELLELIFPPGHELLETDFPVMIGIEHPEQR